MKVNIKFLIAALFTVFLCNTNLYSQNLQIKGVVTDREGEPIVGAYVLPDGQSQGALTDGNGSFELFVEAGKQLTCSFLGFETAHVTAVKTKLLTIVMEESRNQLDEVVVTGYSSMAKKDIAGAISVLKVDDSNERTGLSSANYLQGKVAGLRIVQNTGAPGTASSINIRGANSISGNNQPLIVIDGVPMENDAINPGSPSDFGYYLNQPPTDILSTINMNEIESIQVMKDASSTAIYGSRAANGVILITTKQGSMGKAKITVNSRLDINFKPREIPMLGTQDYFTYLDEASYNSRGTFFDGPHELPLENRKTAPNTNWQHEMFQGSLSHDHNVNVAGGKKGDRYSMNLGFSGAQGPIQNSDYSRFSVRFNNVKDFNARLSLQFNSSFSYTSTSRMPQGPGMASQHSTVLNALVCRPYISPYNDEGEIDASTVGVGNPLAIIKGTDDETKIIRFDMNAVLNYKITDWLALNYQLSGGHSSISRDAYWSLDTAFGRAAGNTALYAPNQSLNYRSVITAVLNKNWKSGHRINAVVGYEWAKWNSRHTTVVSRNFPNDSFKSDNFGAATSQIPTTSGRMIKALSSVIMRMSYSYADRYAITFTGRVDGSSLLAPGHQYSFFPSVGLVWNIDQEKFFSPIVEKFNTFKLRGSYGLTGNQNAGNGAYLSKYTAGSSYLGSGTWLPAFSYSSFSNPDLTWEKTAQANIGFDMGFLKDRVKLSFDWYMKDTYDLLIARQIPTSNGMSSFWDNDGHVRNTGVELELSADVIKSKGFKWNLSYNFSHNKNKIMSLGSSGFMGRTYWFSANASPNNISIAKEGYPIGAFWGHRFDGIYQNKAEVEQGPTLNGRVMTPGDMRYKNIFDSDDSKNDINSDDKAIIGSPYPVFSMGLTNELSYKGFSLSFLLDCNFGQKVANLNRFYTDGLTVLTPMAGGANTYNVSERAYQNRWRGEGTSNYFPKPKMGTQNLDGIFSDFVIEDASFVKLRYVTLAYTFRFKKLIRSLRLFVTGTNLLTITKYKGYDPEVNGSGQSAIDQGIDLGCIPIVRTCSVGISLNF